MRVRTHHILIAFLLLLAVFAVVWRGRIGRQGDVNLTSRAMNEIRRGAGDGQRTRHIRPLRHKKVFPVLDWDTALKHAKIRNRLELEGRLALIDERFHPSDNLKLNLRSHMEGYYAAWERGWTKNGRWTWPDHREIAWSSICASLFVSDEDRRVYKAFSQDVQLQRTRNIKLAETLLADLKTRIDIARYQEDMLLPFLAAYQTFEQGWGRVDAKAAPWSDGLRTGQLDPVCEILKKEQQEEFFLLLSNSGK